MITVDAGLEFEYEVLTELMARDLPEVDPLDMISRPNRQQSMYTHKDRKWRPIKSVKVKEGLL